MGKTRKHGRNNRVWTNAKAIASGTATSATDTRRMTSTIKINAQPQHDFSHNQYKQSKGNQPHGTANTCGWTASYG